MKWITILIMGVMISMISLATASIDYTYSSKTECNGKVCNKELYSGTMFAKSNKGEWVTWDKAESLKDNGFNIKYLEDDGTHKIEVIDFNATSIKVKLDLRGITIFPYSTDLKVLDISGSSLDNFKLGAVELVKQTASFSLLSQSQTLTLPFGYNKAIEFGKNSTTITLVTPNSENLGDTVIDSANPNDNYGGDVSLSFNHNNPLLIKFNLTSIPIGSTIDSANLVLVTYTRPISGSRTANFYILNKSWNEGNLSGTPNTASVNGTTWNQRWFCTDNSCNWTIKGGDLVYLITNTYSMPNSLTNYTFNLTNATQMLVSGNYVNYGYYINVTTTSNYGFRTKEYDTNQRPRLIITYTEPPSTLVNCTGYSGSGNYTTQCDCIINDTIDLAGNSFITNTSGSLYTQANVTNIGSWKLNYNCTIVVGNGKRFG